MKKIISAACIAAALLSGYSIYNTSNETNIDSVVLENIEALASGDVNLPVECYDKYNAYGSNPKRFRPCDTSSCTHIWAYSPKKKTICPNS